MVNTKIKMIYSCIRGASHIQTGKPCQDYISGKILRYKDGSETLLLAIADGHGAELHDRSEAGSKAAVHCALDVLTSIVKENLALPGLQVLNLIQNQFAFRVKERWVEETQQDAIKQGDTGYNVVRYGTTLMIAVKVENLLLIGKLGDGNAVVGYKGQTRILWEDEEADRSRYTNSLCMTDSSQRFEWVAMDGVDRLMVSTDGLVNAIAEYGQLPIIMNYFVDMSREQDDNQTKTNLQAFLEACTSAGCGDDITVGVVDFAYPKHEGEVSR